MLANPDVVKEQDGDVQSVAAGQFGIGIHVYQFQWRQPGGLCQVCQFEPEFVTQAAIRT